MLKQFSPAVLLFVLSSSAIAIALRGAIIPSGTEITHRTDTAIKADAETTNGTRMYSGTVTEDLMDSSGNVLIPREAPAQLAAIKDSRASLTLDLRTLTIRGRSH